MNKILPSILFIVGMALLYFTGGSLNCVSVAGYSECWSFSDKNMTSDLCAGNATSCLAAVDDQRYNAHISALLKACGKASNEGYAVQGTNEAIKNAVNDMFNQTIEARDLCENPAGYLVYREYGAP
ncbi:MAG: hypothetical protein J4431_00425 [Candidatus Aenigmarchaeota archaeon]|nr:hypothetical protein [Candidatus Aenigmarchaeota archaeon]